MAFDFGGSFSVVWLLCIGQMVGKIGEVMKIRLNSRFGFGKRHYNCEFCRDWPKILVIFISIKFSILLFFALIIFVFNPDLSLLWGSEN